MSMKKLIELDDFEGIKKAVIAGEDVNSTDRSGATALMRAIVKKDKEMAYSAELKDALTTMIAAHNNSDENQKEAGQFDIYA